MNEKLFFAMYGFLLKGGAGSGVRGHQTNRDAWERSLQYKTPLQGPKPRTLQLHELPPESAERPNVTKYKKLLEHMGESAEGRFTYDPRTDTIHAISQDAVNMLQSIVEKKRTERATQGKAPAAGKKP